MLFNELPDRLRKNLLVVGDCWLWQKALYQKGYAVVTKTRGTRHGHRAVWMLANNVGHSTQIPAGMEVAHSCTSKNCMNPAHLSLKTTKENAADKQTLNRPVGWTPIAVQLEIQKKRRDGKHLQTLADEYQLHWRTIQEICLRKFPADSGSTSTSKQEPGILPAQESPGRRATVFQSP